MVHTQRRPHVTRIRAHRVPKCLQLTKQVKSVHNGGQFHSVHEQLAPAAHPRRKDTEHNTSCKHSDACYAQVRHARGRRPQRRFAQASQASRKIHFHRQLRNNARAPKATQAANFLQDVGSHALALSLI